MSSSQNMKTASHHRRDTGANEIFVWFTFAALCLFSAAAARPQAQHGTHEAAVRIPSEILERPVPLRHGIGNVHEEVTTSSPEAQGFYDQGLAYLHSFVWIEAARSFHQALRLDSSFAMAYLGLSDVFVGLQDVTAARAAFDKAQSFAEKLSDPERARIRIRARQLE